MALSITDLAVELRIIPESIALLEGGDREVVSRLLNFANSMVAARTMNAPEPLSDQAVVQIAAYRFDQPNASAGAGYADVWRNSGAAATLASYTLFRRAIAIDVDPEVEAVDGIPLTIEAAIRAAIAEHTAQPYVHHDPPNVGEETIRRIVSTVLEGAGLEPIAPDERPLYFALKQTADFTEADYLAGEVSSSDFFDLPIFAGEMFYSLAEPADRIRRRFVGAIGGFDFLAANAAGIDEISIGGELHRTYTTAFPNYDNVDVESWVASPPLPYRFVSAVSPQSITDAITAAIDAHAAIVAAHHAAPDVSAFATLTQVAAAIVTGIQNSGHLGAGETQVLIDQAIVAALAALGYLSPQEVQALIDTAIAAIPAGGGGAVERLWTAVAADGDLQQSGQTTYPLPREITIADVTKMVRVITRDHGPIYFSVARYLQGEPQSKHSSDDSPGDKLQFQPGGNNDVFTDIKLSATGGSVRIMFIDMVP